MQSADLQLHIGLSVFEGYNSQNDDDDRAIDQERKKESQESLLTDDCADKLNDDNPDESNK